MTPFDRLRRQVRDPLDNVVQNITAAIGQSLAEKTPVLTGHAVAGWSVTNGKTSSSAKNDFDPSRSETIERLTEFATEVKAGDVITWINEAKSPEGHPYPNVLEFGHSKQAPLGMVRLTAAEIRLMIPALVSRTFTFTPLIPRKRG